MLLTRNTVLLKRVLKRGQDKSQLTNTHTHTVREKNTIHPQDIKYFLGRFIKHVLSLIIGVQIHVLSAQLYIFLLPILLLYFLL
jgi:hypothetical protein